jgi:hypothetical protein
MGEASTVERAIDLGGEVFSKPEPQEAPADLVLAGVRMAGPETGKHECPGKVIGLHDQLHLLPGRHPPVDLQLDPLRLGVGVRVKDPIRDLMGLELP